MGGNPFWPASRKWPTTENGNPYRFFAQFNFADSRDLIDDLPGEMLLMFVNEDDEWLFEPMGTHFEWVALKSGTLFQVDPALIAEKAGPFFGAIFRSADYPDASERAYEAGYGLVDILNGTKIGGVPHFIQSSQEFSGQFLCQLNSIQAAPEVPYPWVNRALPLELGFGEDSIHSKDNEVMFGDLGAIYIWRDDAGRVSSSFACY